MCPQRLTFHQRGWHRGWHGCCPCPPGSALARRTSVVCSEWRTAVSPGWCPGGPGSPRTGRWCDRLPADSSLDPCSPRGHLTRSKKRRGCQATLCKIDSLRHCSFCLKAWADPRCTWSTLKVQHPTSAAPGFAISNLDEIKTDATICPVLYWSGSLDPLHLSLSGTQTFHESDKNKPLLSGVSQNPQQWISLTVGASPLCETNNRCMNNIYKDKTPARNTFG